MFQRQLKIALAAQGILSSTDRGTDMTLVVPVPPRIDEARACPGGDQFLFHITAQDSHACRAKLVEYQTGTIPLDINVGIESKSPL